VAFCSGTGGRLYHFRPFWLSSASLIIRKLAFGRQDACQHRYATGPTPSPNRRYEGSYPTQLDFLLPDTYIVSTVSLHILCRIFQYRSTFGTIHAISKHYTNYFARLLPTFYHMARPLPIANTMPTTSHDTSCPIRAWHTACYLQGPCQLEVGAPLHHPTSHLPPGTP
jgi:hypothetical protein